MLISKHAKSVEACDVAVGINAYCVLGGIRVFRSTSVLTHTHLFHLCRSVLTRPLASDIWGFEGRMEVSAKKAHVHPP